MISGILCTVSERCDGIWSTSQSLEGIILYLNIIRKASLSMQFKTGSYHPVYFLNQQHQSCFDPSMNGDLVVTI